MFYCDFREVQILAGPMDSFIFLLGYGAFHTQDTGKGSACDFLLALLTASDEYHVGSSCVMSPVSLSLFPKPFFIRNLNSLT